MLTLPFIDLLSLVEASGGRIEHRVRIQKEAYLLRWAGLPVFRAVRFTFYSHGPSSRELSDVLHRAVATGYLSELPNADADITYVYELTPQATQLRIELRVSSDPLKDLAARLNAEHWSALELAATALFLQEEECTSTPLWDRAIALRPATSSFLDRARGLVTELSALKARNVAAMQPLS
jgi:uncharacterized protein YwgA